MSETLTAILVDDESKARENLRTLLETNVPEIKIAGEAHSVSTALEALAHTEPDILFLDINMPSGNGFSLLEKLEHIPFEVIFVTAHEQHALDAIRYSALDYLLKPVDVEDLRHAVARAMDKRRTQHYTDDLSVLVDFIKNRSYADSKLLLPNKDGLIVADMQDIVRCEGEGNYTTIYFSNRPKIVESKTLKHYQQLLDPQLFFRIYQSHLVNLRHIKEYQSGRGGAVLMSDGARLPVSRDKKQDFIKKLHQQFDSGPFGLFGKKR